MSHQITEQALNSRREYGQSALTEKMVAASPMLQFESWFLEAMQTELDDPTAMVLSTVDRAGRPDSRVVLLKGVELGAFVFYTNYNSTKAQELSTMPHVALNFYWSKMARQVRIRGEATRVSGDVSDAYFASRPRMSQLGALASHQSEVIPDREVLEDRLRAVSIEYPENTPIPRPSSWGGFAVCPVEIEFWQGRDNRLHDRIHYEQVSQNKWSITRLSP